MTSYPAALSRVIRRDLQTVLRELDAYASERDVWVCPPGIDNSAGTLALHLAGNIQHFIGAQLGGTEYVRDRDAEFADRDVPRRELRSRIEAAIEVVDRTLTSLDDDVLDGPFPLEFKGKRVPTVSFLTHLAAHLAYHLGQIDYHRRVVTGTVADIHAQSVQALLR